MRNLIAALLLTPTLALAGPGIWHQPDRDGHGIVISQPSEAGSAVLWFLYTRDGSATFLIGEPCPEFPCVTPLFQPSAGWLGGGLELGDEVGSVELSASGEQLRVVFDLRGLSPDECAGITPGGLLFRECVGTLTLERLTD